jgi:glycyl-tRNA synthetase beta chain
LSIGDKADTIAGMFALGLQPTSSKDPFALRRQANGIVKTIAEHKLPLSLPALVGVARDTYRGSSAEKRFKAANYDESIRAFFRERLEFYLRDQLGFSYDVVNAVLAAGGDDVVDAIARAEAVKSVLKLPEFLAVAAASKRIRNILKQAAEKKFAIATHFRDLPESPQEEKLLGAYVERNSARIEQFRRAKDYSGALHLLATARDTVDAFFDKVMVMVENELMRANRLALLQRLAKEFSTIADFSEIVTEGKA